MTIDPRTWLSPHYRHDRLMFTVDGIEYDQTNMDAQRAVPWRIPDADRPLGEKLDYSAVPGCTCGFLPPCDVHHGGPQ